MRTVLIVEDDAIQAMALEGTVVSLGFQVLATAMTVKQAMSVLATATPDAAIVDLSLRGEDSTPIIEVLESRKVPIAVTTGSDGNATARFARHLVLLKPFEEKELAAALRSWFPALPQ